MLKYHAILQCIRLKKKLQTIISDLRVCDKLANPTQISK